MSTQIIDAGRDTSGGYKVDVSRGANVDCVSSEWFSRPDDERYLSLDEDGAETGMCTIPAGGRRFRALDLLVKQKRMNKIALVPCIVRTDGLAEEDSLAENVQRAPLHPPPKTKLQSERRMTRSTKPPSKTTRLSAPPPSDVEQGRA